MTQRMISSCSRETRTIGGSIPLGRASTPNRGFAQGWLHSGFSIVPRNKREDKRSWYCEHWRYRKEALCGGAWWSLNGGPVVRPQRLHRGRVKIGKPRWDYSDVFQAPGRELEFNRAAFHPERRKQFIGTDVRGDNKSIENILLQKTAKTVKVTRWDVEMNIVPPRRVLVQQIRHHTIHRQIAGGRTKEESSQRKTSQMFQPFS